MGFSKIITPTERDAHTSFMFRYTVICLCSKGHFRRPVLNGKEDYHKRQSMIFLKITVTFDFQPKFPDFLAKW